MDDEISVKDALSALRGKPCQLGITNPPTVTVWYTGRLAAGSKALGGWLFHVQHGGGVREITLNLHLLDGAAKYVSSAEGTRGISVSFEGDDYSLTLSELAP